MLMIIFIIAYGYTETTWKKVCSKTIIFWITNILLYQILLFLPVENLSASRTNFSKPEHKNIVKIII